MGYLSLQEIFSKEEDIKCEAALLLSNKAVVFKPNSLQWQFFKNCIYKLFNSSPHSIFDSLNNSHKAQEVSYEIYIFLDYCCIVGCPFSRVEPTGGILFK